MSTAHGYAYLNPIAQNYFYYYLRLVSIGVNFVISICTIWIIRSKGRTQNTKDGSIKPSSVVERAIRTLAMRLMYYPIVQTISRAGCAWYEGQYSFNLDPTNPSTAQFIAQIAVAVLTPTASFGYLAIFLLMQPNAYECLVCTVMCREYKPKNHSAAGDIMARQSNMVHNSLHHNQDSESGGNTSYPHPSPSMDDDDRVYSRASAEFDMLRDANDEDLFMLVNASDNDYYRGSGVSAPRGSTFGGAVGTT
eukprot:gene24062-30362_t